MSVNWNALSGKVVDGTNIRKKHGGEKTKLLTKFIFQSSKISLTQPISYFKIEEADLGEVDLHVSFYPWKEVFPLSYKEPALLLKVIQSIIQQDKGDLSAFSEIILDQWAFINSTHKEIGIMLEELHKLDKISQIITSKREMGTKIENLYLAREYIERQSNASYLGAQRNLLEKLIQDETILQPQFEIAEDEYSSIQRQITQYLTQEDQFNTQQNHLKTRQRDLFQETNEITKRMDDLDPKLTTYREKIADLDPDDENSSIERLRAKLDKVQKDYDLFGTERKNLMKKSQELKKTQIRERKNFKDVKKHLSRLRPLHDQKKNEFETLSRRNETLKRQIETIKKELASRILAKPTSDEDSMDNITINYSSSQEIEDQILLIQSKLEKIDSILEKQFSTTDLSQIQPKLTKRYSTLQTHFDSLNSNTNLESQIEQYAHGSEMQLLKLNRMKNWINYFLTPLELIFNFELSISAPNKDLLVNLNVMNMKGEIINVEEDLTRFQSAFLIFSIIIAIYLSLDIKLVPLCLSHLPKSIITKQTFQRTIESLTAQIQAHPSLQDLQLVFFFDIPQSYDLSIQDLTSIE
ncbi:MAG: hypothetical protein ACTSYI_08760 [Promethearchaeota archaeon]